MSILKIVVTDSGGVEHIFNETDDQVVCLNLTPQTDPSRGSLKGAILIETLIFDPPKKTYAQREESFFLAPRRVDVIFGPFEE